MTQARYGARMNVHAEFADATGSTVRSFYDRVAYHALGGI